VRQQNESFMTIYNVQKLLTEWRKYLTEAGFVDLAADVAGAPKDEQDFFKEKKRLEKLHGADKVHVRHLFDQADNLMLHWINPSDTRLGKRPANQKYKDLNTCKIGPSHKEECMWSFLTYPAEQPKASPLAPASPVEPQRISRKGPVGLPQDTIKNKIKQVENEIKKLPRVAFALASEGGWLEPIWVPQGKPTPKYAEKVLTVRQYLYLFYKYRKCLPAAVRKNFLNGFKDDNVGCEGKKWQTLPYGFNVDPVSDPHGDKISTSFRVDNLPSAQKLKKGGIVDPRSLAIVRRKYFKLKTKLKQLKSIKAVDPTMLDPVDVTPIKEVFERYL